MQLSTLTDVDECPRSNVTGSRGSFQTPETTKPSHFCEGFILYGAAPGVERLYIYMIYNLFIVRFMRFYL